MDRCAVSAILSEAKDDTIMAFRSVPHIVVVGSGFAGLEAAFTLRSSLGDRADVTVVSTDAAFTMRPDTIYLPFGASLEKMRTPIAEPLGRRGIPLVCARVDDIVPDAGVLLAEGRELFFDYAVIATGASPHPEEIGGLPEHGITLWAPLDLERLRDRFLRLRDEARRGAALRALFVVPPHNDWAAPLYEMVLMFETWLRRQGVREAVDIRLATHERGFLRSLGERMHQLLAHELMSRNIDTMCSTSLYAVRDHVAYFNGGDAIPFDLLVAAPPQSASTDFRSLPRDSRGFALVDQATRRSLGNANVFIAGDAADFPVKQAVLALLQADAAAAAIVGELEGHEPRFTFASTSVLLIDALDSALFAQVPLHASDTPGAPPQVVEHGERYLVGRSAAWRIGRRAMSAYLRWRLQSGKPFHAGTAWRRVNDAMRLMERTFAH